MDIWCCCQQCWPETPVVTWGHIARQQGTVHSTLATVHQWTHGPLRYQSSPCKKWHCLDLFKVQDVLPQRIYCPHVTTTGTNVKPLLIVAEFNLPPMTKTWFFVSDYYMESNYLWLLYCSELTRVICSETFSTRRGVTGPGGGTSEHSSIAEATHGRSKYSFDLMTLSILDIQQWHYITVL